MGFYHRLRGVRSQPRLCTAVHCASLNWQLWTSVSKISCAVWWLNGREKMAPVSFSALSSKVSLQAPENYPTTHCLDGFVFKTLANSYHAPAPSKAKLQLNDEFLKRLVGLIYLSLSLSILSRTFSAWLFFGKFMANQPTNAKHANLEQKIRFKTSFVSRSPWYPSIYSQGPCNPLKPPPAFRQSLPLGGSGQRKKVPSTSRRKPTKYSLFLADRGCWQWSVMIHLCPKNGVF